jgi:hypothetical protein
MNFYLHILFVGSDTSSEVSTDASAEELYNPGHESEGQLPGGSTEQTHPVGTHM